MDTHLSGYAAQQESPTTVHHYSSPDLGGVCNVLPRCLLEGQLPTEKLQILPPCNKLGVKPQSLETSKTENCWFSQTTQVYASLTSLTSGQAVFRIIQVNL